MSRSLGGDGADVDDASAALRAHDLECLLGAVEHASDVGVHDAEPFFGGKLLDRVSFDGAGVVYEDVEASVGVHDGFEDNGYAVFIGYVHG